MSGVSVPSITDLVGVGISVVAINKDGVCRLMLLSRCGANGVFRSSSMSRSCSWPKVVYPVLRRSI